MTKMRLSATVEAEWLAAGRAAKRRLRARVVVVRTNSYAELIPI